MTLVEFLLARIAEDEAACLTDAYFGPPTMDDPAPMRMDYDEMQIGPRRWLAECEAKRRIVDLHSGDNDEMTCQSGNWLTEPCPTIRALALIYADHPDYRAEWRS